MALIPNKKNIRKWVNALRGKKHRKTTGALHDTRGYCCLGVACDISGIAKWEKSPHYPKTSSYLNRDGSLPRAVQKWLGINDTDPILLINENDRWRASELNDGNGPGKFGFKKIADLIETKYLKTRKPNAQKRNSAR